jgi:hypothetical protein
VHTPYITAYGDAFAIAQTSVATVLTAVVWRAPMRPAIAKAPLLAAIWLASIVGFEPQLLASLGATVAPDHAAFVLTLARCLAVIAFAIAPPRWLAIPVALGGVVLWKVGGFLEDSLFEVSVAHVAFFALAHAVRMRLVSPSPAPLDAPPRRSFAIHDFALFAIATTVASVVCVVVLEKFCNSGDEWAYTYQADLLAHFKAYGDVPACPSLFQNYWVFFYMGRAFSQYTPGWPLLMAPLQRLGIVWLATPILFGLMCVGVARLARRAAAASTSDAREIAWAGTIAGASALLPVGMLLNAGSRFPHVPVAACIAWAIESACACTDSQNGKRAQWAWGAGLGVSCALMLAIRHSDGALFGLALALPFLVALVRRRVPWRALAGASIAFAILGAVTLVILRLQLGAWFKTGYSISGEYFAWAKTTFSMPKPSEFKYGIPLGTGAYMWWPCAPALGLAGLVLARGRAVSIAVTLVLGSLMTTALYTAVEFGRGYDSGYGPRYQLPSVVAMAVGGGLLLAPLARDAAGTIGPRLKLAGPAVLAAFAALAGVVRIALLVFPEAHAEARTDVGVHRAIDEAHLDRAVVTVQGSDVKFDPLDQTQNLPTDRDPKVLVLLKKWGPEAECGRKRFADRKWYRAIQTSTDVRLEPE